MNATNDALPPGNVFFDALTDSLPNSAAFVVDQSLRYRLARGAALSDAGLSPADIEGKLVTDLVPPDELGRYVSNVRTALAGRRFVHEHQVGSRHFASRGTPLKDSSGEVYAALILSYDVTERRANERMLLETVEMMQERDHRKDEFLAVLAHELRNPLTPIVHGITVLEDDASLSEQARQLLPMLRRQVTNLSHLVNELMDLSRINSSQFRLSRQPFDLREVVQSAVEASQPLIAEYCHDLELHGLQAPYLMEGDPRRLGQVITNLLTNACKYTPPGGKIGVRVTVDQQSVIVQVTDNGIGIEPQMLPLIFNAFVQVERMSDMSRGGLGLGLSIVRKLVALHGGTVSAESAGLNKGSRFTVRLPVNALWA